VRQGLPDQALVLADELAFGPSRACVAEGVDEILEGFRSALGLVKS
jgi:hypothetical protein